MDPYVDVLMIPSNKHPCTSDARRHIEQLTERELDALCEECGRYLPKKVGDNDTGWYSRARNVLFDAADYVNLALYSLVGGVKVIDIGGMTLIVAVGDTLKPSALIESFILFKRSGAAKAAGYIVD